jgi:hypothetical protein
MATRLAFVFVASAILVSSTPKDVRAGSLVSAAERGALRGVTRSVERNAVRSLDGHVFRSVERRQLRVLTRRDLLNHERARVVPLTNPREVFRFTTRERAGRELRLGIAPDRHMTAHTKPGRPLAAESAMRRFGLPRRPQVRETIRIPTDQPIRFNRVVGGSPGVGELTSPRRLPPQVIKRMIPIH